jgi:enoyl-CoA hydratase/carnithine racemase
VLAGIGRCARAANAATKTLLRTVPETASERSIDAAAAAFVAAIGGEEAREGISAFVEKRPANWISQP